MRILFVAMLLVTTHASAANICQAAKLTCPTTMPIGGFCECTAHGVTKDGTAIAKTDPHAKVNATGAGCGAASKSPGCR